MTYRGHTAPITSLCISGANERIYSASLDSTVQIWALPSRGDNRDTYAPFDASFNLGRLEGHTDGVWDVCLLGGSSPDTEVLASASADGTVKIWDVSPGNSQSSLKLSWTAQGTDGQMSDEANSGSGKGKGRAIPTSLALCQTDMTKLAVAYTDAIVRIFDTETGKLVMTLQSSEGYGACRSLSLPCPIDPAG